MLNLIIKGNRYQAALEAAKRGIPFVVGGETKSREYTYGMVGDQWEADVQAWFCEKYPVPYPIGACMHYGTRQETK